MVTCLAALTRLENLKLKFHTPRPLTDQESRRPPPLTRSVLPALNVLWFKGVSEYLEDLVAWIDAPLLHDLEIIFFPSAYIRYSTASPVHQSCTSARHT